MFIKQLGEIWKITATKSNKFNNRVSATKDYSKKLENNQSSVNYKTIDSKDAFMRYQDTLLLFNLEFNYCMFTLIFMCFFWFLLNRSLLQAVC